MWASSDKYTTINIGGGRPLGDYTEEQRELEAFYNLAQQAASPDGVVYANIDVPDNTFELAEDDIASLAYGLEPHLVAPKYAPMSMVTQMPNAQGGMTNVARTMLRQLLHKIVEDA